MSTLIIYFIAIFDLTLVLVVGNYFARRKFSTRKAKPQEDVYPLY